MGRVQVEVLPVYDPSDEEAGDPALFSANVRKVSSTCSLRCSELPQSTGCCGHSKSCGRQLCKVTQWQV